MNTQTPKELFQKNLTEYTTNFNNAVSTSNGDWIVKGFIDVSKNIYTISVDTKVVSKIMEILLFPKFCEFAEMYDYKLLLTEHQNHYPDLSFVDSDGNKFAVDIKSSYKKNSSSINGMTLGAFTGYFRNRGSHKNIKFPYEEYAGHFVFGLIYTRVEDLPETDIFKLEDLQNISSVIKDFTFFVQEKYKIATDRPGSGNTKNIGSVTLISKLTKGLGPFSKLGEEVFDDYWMSYLTKDMAKAAELAKMPYKNLIEYKTYKNLD